ncbi:MAG: FbpB family small basic protein [Bacillota bacterium]
MRKKKRTYKELLEENKLQISNDSIKMEEILTVIDERKMKESIIPLKGIESNSINA